MHVHGLSFPKEEARRTAAWSLLMVPASAAAVVVAGVVGTFLQLVVFELGEQEMLSAAGTWGYVGGAFLVVLMVVPGLLGTALGVRARRLGERRIGTTGVVVNVLVVTLLLVAGVVGLVLD